MDLTIYFTLLKVMPLSLFILAFLVSLLIARYGKNSVKRSIIILIFALIGQYLIENYSVYWGFPLIAIATLILSNSLISYLEKL